MASTLTVIRELARQKVNDDANFLKRILYFFELRVPSRAAYFFSTSYLYPLIVPPVSYSLEEPFSIESTPTQGGGLFTEENGIIQRTIRLKGHTGFRPRDLKLKGLAKSALVPTKNTSYSRELPEIIVGALSGQKHFHYLQDTVFRTYADLKRDPSTAKDTHLIFHNPKDREHWLVSPISFKLSQDASAPLLYNYDIELLVVDKATAVSFNFSEDQSLFDSIKSFISTIKKVIDGVTGAINDLTALLGEIKSFIQNIASIIDSVTNIVNAAKEFTDGLSEFIQHPFASIETAIDQLESALGIVNNTMETDTSGRTFPVSVKQKLHTIVDNLEILGRYPSLFESPQETEIRKIREQQEFRRSVSDTEKEEALAVGSPSSFDEVKNLGTQLTAGDVLSGEGQLSPGGEIQKFTSAREVVIGEGDTLATLAARYMGDARLWQYIAILNGLRPPFVDTQAGAPLAKGIGSGSTVTGALAGADESPFPGALGLGSKILIPSNQPSTLSGTGIPVAGVKATEALEAQYLGTDFALEPVDDVTGSGRVQYDFVIDTAHGSVDCKTVSGIDNLVQVATTILLTEKGQDPLYRNLGTEKIVGLGTAGIDLEIIRFRLQEAWLSDPRIGAIKNMTLELNQDVLKIDFELAAHGFAETRTIRLSL